MRQSHPCPRPCRGDARLGVVCAARARCRPGIRLLHGRNTQPRRGGSGDDVACVAGCHSRRERDVHGRLPRELGVAGSRTFHLVCVPVSRRRAAASRGWCSSASAARGIDVLRVGSGEYSRGDTTCALITTASRAIVVLLEDDESADAVARTLDDLSSDGGRVIALLPPDAWHRILFGRRRATATRRMVGLADSARRACHLRSRRPGRPGGVAARNRRIIVCRSCLDGATCRLRPSTWCARSHGSLATGLRRRRHE